MNGNVPKSKRERQKGQEIATDERSHKLFFCCSCLLLAALPLSESLRVPRGRRAQETLNDEESLDAFAILHHGVVLFFYRHDLRREREDGCEVYKPNGKWIVTGIPCSYQQFSICEKPQAV